MSAKSKIICLSGQSDYWPGPLNLFLYQFSSDTSSRKANVCLVVCFSGSNLSRAFNCHHFSQLFLSSISEILCLILSISHFQFLWMPDVIIHDLVKFSKPEILNEVAALEIFKNKMVYYKIRYV